MRRTTRIAIIGGAALAALAWGGQASAGVSDPMAVVGNPPADTLPVIGDIPQAAVAPVPVEVEAPAPQAVKETQRADSPVVLSVADEPSGALIIPPKGFLASLISACEMALHVPGASAPVLALMLLVAFAAAPTLGRRMSAFQPLGSDLRLAREVIAPG